MIYFIFNAGSRAIKIGRSDSPTARLRSLQTGSPERLELLAVMPGGQAEELALHERFAEHRIAGEWFRDNDEIRALIGTLLDQGARINQLAEFFRSEQAPEPDLCALASTAVGFPVSVFQWVAYPKLGDKGPTQYQVMPWDTPEQDGPIGRFWCWHLGNKEQWFLTPLAACLAFAASWQGWVGAQQESVAS